MTPGSSTASVLAQLPIDNTTKIKNDGGDDGNDESSIAEKRSGSADDENPMF